MCLPTRQCLVPGLLDFIGLCETKVWSINEEIDIIESLPMTLYFSVRKMINTTVRGARYRWYATVIFKLRGLRAEGPRMTCQAAMPRRTRDYYLAWLLNSCS
jgi:hypothetical protein